MNSFQVLVDSDAWVAWSMPDDLFHRQVQAVFERLAQRKAQLVSTSWVIAETATVLSYRSGQVTARLFLEHIASLDFPIIHVTEAFQADATQLFKLQDARGTSMVDCGNAVVMGRFDIPEIFSFDKFYRRLQLRTVQ